MSTRLVYCNRIEIANEVFERSDQTYDIAKRYYVCIFMYV